MESSIRTNWVGGAYGHACGKSIQALRKMICSPFHENAVPRNEVRSNVILPIVYKSTQLVTGLVPCFISVKGNGQAAAPQTSPPTFAFKCCGKRFNQVVRQMRNKKDQKLVNDVSNCQTAAIYNGARILDFLNKDLSLGTSEAVVKDALDKGKLLLDDDDDDYSEDDDDYGDGDDYSEDDYGEDDYGEDDYGEDNYGEDDNGEDDYGEDGDGDDNYGGDGDGDGDDDDNDSADKDKRMERYRQSFTNDINFQPVGGHVDGSKDCFESKITLPLEKASSHQKLESYNLEYADGLKHLMIFKGPVAPGALAFARTQTSTICMALSDVELHCLGTEFHLGTRTLEMGDDHECCGAWMPTDQGDAFYSGAYATTEHD